MLTLKFLPLLQVSIGVDIVHFPPVIFLDEPTSGLDSSTALSVIDSLKQLACQQNCTVVMTIHQPSTRLFNLLDRVLFLSAGHVTYFGPTSGLNAEIHDIYTEAKLGTNTACVLICVFYPKMEFVVKRQSRTIFYSLNNPSPAIVGEPPIANPPEVFLDLCDELSLAGRLELITSRHVAPPASIQQIASVHRSEDSYANSFLGETAILGMRSLTNILRTPELFLARLGSLVGFAVLIGTLTLNTNTSSAGLRHRLSYFIFNIAFFFYTSLEALPIFLQEREIFQREYSRGAYRAISYTVATQVLHFACVSYSCRLHMRTCSWYSLFMCYHVTYKVVSMPFSLVLAFVFTAISWWLIGLENQADPFFFHVLCLFTVLVAGNTFATMMSVIVPNPMAGTCPFAPCTVHYAGRCL